MSKVGEWLGNKFFNIGGVVDKKINERLENVYRVKITGSEFNRTQLFNYRQQEYRTWANGDADKLLEFYSTRIKASPFDTERLLFWNWVRGAKVPKIHYSTPQRIINQMTSLLFSQEIDCAVDSGNKSEDKKLNKQLKDILLNIPFYELLQKSVNYETYSGTLAWKPILDTEISQYPIIEPYPAENVVFRTSKKIVQEVIFLDEYSKDKKNYILKSIYGKGYIKYELWEDSFKKQHSLDTIPELAGLKNVVILDKRTGKPLDIMLASYKKNREVNNEFPESVYGGSDFQGIVDSFQLIDELYSQKQLVIRRSRPIARMSESIAPYNLETGTVKIPKEYEYDIFLTKKDTDLKDDGKLQRDIPSLEVAQYDQAIVDELKNIFATIGMAYTTVGLEVHSANISGVALESKEKATVIIRNNKIRLWKRFLAESLRLMVLYNSLKNADVSEQDDAIVFTVDDTSNHIYQVEFPSFYDLSIDEKVDSVRKLVELGVCDLDTAFDRVFGSEYEEGEKEKILRNAKLERGIPLLDSNIVEEESS